MIEETLAQLVDRFNRHADQNPGVGEELKGVHRTIALKLADGRAFGVVLSEGRLGGLTSSMPAKPDVTIRTDADTFLALVRKETGPMKALVTGKLAIDGSLDDKLLFRKLL
ncbi:MAG: SCP2 sterol-binding domain-containing protein [Thermoplasmata archaeon]|nr:SCP2 sterol-binding domain-containing protein [Thermoplasmata archaeon]